METDKDPVEGPDDGPDDQEKEDGTEEKPSFETLLDTLGHFGRFQIMVFSLLTISDIMNAMIMMYLVFGLATPDWWCRQFDGLNVTDLLDSPVHNRSFEKTCEYNGSKCVKFEFDPRFESIVTEWNLVCDLKYVPKLTTTMLMLGLLIGTLVASQISDLFGRKYVIAVSATVMVFAQTMVGLSPSWQVHLALRFCVGLFLGANISMCYVLPMEYIGPRWRSVCGALGIWDLGSSLTALVAYFLTNWRHQAYFSGTVFIPLVVIIVICVPESARWLIQKRRFEEATVILTRMARVNKKPLPDLSLLEQISQSQNAAQREEARYTYLDLFSTRRLVALTLVVMFCWFAASCIYYGIIVSVSDLSGDMYLNVVYSSLPGMFLGWTVIPMANWIGRKPTFYLYITVPILAMFGIVVLYATGLIEEQGTVRTILALIGKVVIGETWTVASLISAEVYPTLMRAIGVGIGNVASRVGGVVAPQIVLLGDMFHWVIPYIINGCLAVVSVVLVAVVFPETKGRPLPENPPPAEQTCLRRICCRRLRRVETEGDAQTQESQNYARV